MGELSLPVWLVVSNITLYFIFYLFILTIYCILILINNIKTTQQSFAEVYQKLGLSHSKCFFMVHCAGIIETQWCNYFSLKLNNHMPTSPIRDVNYWSLCMCVWPYQSIWVFMRLTRLIKVCVCSQLIKMPSVCRLVSHLRFKSSLYLAQLYLCTQCHCVLFVEAHICIHSLLSPSLSLSRTQKHIPYHSLSVSLILMKSLCFWLSTVNDHCTCRILCYALCLTYYLKKITGAWIFLLHCLLFTFDYALLLIHINLFNSDCLGLQISC